ncbi:esterase/lipase family protein [Kitasatospora sp. NPDC127067]|uniref:esterase/lipase family protein n=1 Tax=Kitasatospora sp. NPDC127067 TaxID=3347126 RepID=UPI0036503FF5
MAAGPPAQATMADQAPSDLTHRPIVFVHGYNAGPGVWGGMKDFARTYGYTDNELWTFDYSALTPGDIPITTIGDELAKYIADKHLTDRSPDGRVDIVAHSMGGLVARSFLADGEAHRSATAHLITLGSPNHGTKLASWGCSVGVKCDEQVNEMTGGSTLITKLNQNGETPGPTRYATFRSNVGDELIVNPGTFDTDLCDRQVFGYTHTGEGSGDYAGDTSALNGADNLVTPCVAHGDLYQDPWTRHKVLDLLADHDGAHTPHAVQVACGELKEFWGERKWVGVHAQSCATAVRPDPGATVSTVRGELLIRGCGYYNTIGVWKYVGRDPEYTCQIPYETTTWVDSQGSPVQNSSTTGTRTIEIPAPDVTARAGQSVHSTWSFDVNAYWGPEWGVKKAMVDSGTMALT